MPLEHLIWDAEANRSRIHDHAAHQRRAAQAPAAPRTRGTMSPRHRLGHALVAVGARLQGLTPPIPEPARLVDPTAAGQPNP